MSSFLEYFLQALTLWVVAIIIFSVVVSIGAAIYHNPILGFFGLMIFLFIILIRRSK